LPKTNNRLGLLEAYFIRQPHSSTGPILHYSEQLLQKAA